MYMKNQVISSKAPQAPNILSQAIESNGLIFVSGQIHNTHTGTLIEGSVNKKMEQIFQNIKEILSEANSNLNNIVKVTIYVTEMSQMEEINDIYPTFFTEPYPAREAICVKELPLNATIEISVIATTSFKPHG